MVKTNAMNTQGDEIKALLYVTELQSALREINIHLIHQKEGFKFIF